MAPKIAIVGAGPSGCYTAQALLRQVPDAEITVIDRLPVPYGLVRYGVAPDHQGTKGVIRQFSRLFEKQGVAFAGNVSVGEDDLGLDEVRAMFDAVVLATGLSADRSLGHEFEGLAGLYGSGLLTRYWNGHPDCAGFAPNFGDTVIVVGNGNVSMDVVRLLAKGPGDFDGSDFNPAHVAESVRQIHIVGRSPAERAKFDSVMVRELGKIPGLSARVDARSSMPEAEGDKRLAALADVCAQGRSGADISLTFHFDWQVDRPISEAGRLRGVRFARGDAVLDLACTSAVTAIGYDDEGTLDRTGLFNGETAHPTGRIAPGLYAAGWFKRGPTGTIPENRADAQAIAALVAEDVRQSDKPGRAALQAALGQDIVTYEDWQAIDAAECQAAEPDRSRQKITTRDAMLAVIAERRAP